MKDNRDHQKNTTRLVSEIDIFKEKFGSDLYDQRGHISIRYDDFKSENEFKLYRMIQDIYDQIPDISRQNPAAKKDSLELYRKIFKSTKS